jgi:DNA-binding response OmpR family regulator
MPRILIAEDEPRITAFLEKGFRAHGFTTTVVSDGETTVELAEGQHFDLLVLDLGIPKKDGLQAIAEIRGRGENIPIVILTARDDIYDKVSALEGGADDYLTKPFRFEELLARVRVQLRHQDRDRSRTAMQLTVGEISLDLRTRRVYVGDRLIELSAREFTLIETFLRHRGQVLSRTQLLSHVWGYDAEPISNVVDVYVGYLRKKLNTDRIETVRGCGYRFR